MIWCLICWGVLALSIVALVIYFETDIIPYSDVISGIISACLVISAIGTLFTGVFAIGTLNGSPTNMIYYEEQYNSLIARINAVENHEEGYDILVNGDLYSDIANYNDRVRSGRYWNNSLWTNWLTMDIWDELPIIEWEVIDDAE